MINSRTVIVLCLLTLGLNAFASDTSLENGLYVTTGNFCGAQVVNDLVKNELIVVATRNPLIANSPCASEGSTDTWKKSGPNEFSITSEIMVDLDGIEKCMPKAEKAFPCRSEIYDSQTGQLLLKLGDVLTYKLQLEIMGTTALRVEPPQMTITRNSNVTKQFPFDPSIKPQIYTKYR